MKNYRKFITLLALVLTVFSIITVVGCNNGTNTDVSSASEETSAEPADTGLLLAGEGAEKYAIVWPEGSSQQVISAATELRKALNAAFSSNIVIKEDWLNEKGGEKPGEYEILLGLTNRQESIECYEKLKDGDYIVTVKGTKLVIIGGSDEAIVKAVGKFTEFFKSKSGSLTFKLSDTISFAQVYPAESITVMGKDISDYPVFYMRGSDCLVTLAEKLSDSVVDTCGKKLSVVHTKPEGSHICLVYSRDSVAEWKCEAKDGIVTVTVGGKLTADKAAEFLSKVISSQKGNAVIDPEKLSSNGSIASDSKYLKDKDTDLRIMTSNLLFTADNISGRMADLSELYHIVLPDVIGFQEYTNSIRNVITNLIADKYALSEPDTKGAMNCTQIAYRKDLYTQLDCGYEPLVPADYTKSISWTVLKNASGYTFAVTSIHCSLNPTDNDTDGGNVLRVENAKQLVRVISDIRTKYPGIDVYSAGDYFNGDTSPAHKYYMENGFVDPVKIATISRSLTGTHHELGSLSTGTQLDMVLANGSGFIVKVHRIITNKLTINASDHSPVYIDVELKK